MSINYLNNIGYVEIKNKAVKKEWMKLLEALCGDSMEDHFYKVDIPKGCCDINNPEYILIIPDKHKKVVLELGVMRALMYSWSFNDTCEEERKTAD